MSAPVALPRASPGGRPPAPASPEARAEAVRAVRRTADGTVLLFLAEALLLPTGLVTAAVLTRRLGPDAYGLFTVAASLVAWLSWIVGSAFSTRAAIALVSEADDPRPVASLVLRVHLVAGAASAGVFALVAPAVADVLGDARLVPLLRLLAVELLLFSAARAYQNVLVGTGAYRPRALGSAVRWTLRMVAVVGFVEAGLGVAGAALGGLLALAAEVVVYRAHRRIPLGLRSGVSGARLWRTAAPLFVFEVVLRGLSRIDLFALKALGGTAAEAGFYGAAQNLTVVPGLFTLAFTPLLLATVGRLSRAGAEAQARRLGHDALRLAAYALPLAAAAAAVAPGLVRALFGAAFAPAAPLLAWLIVGAAAQVTVSVGSALLVSAGRPAWTTAIAVPMVAVAAAGYLVAFPLSGAVGMAAVTVATMALGGVAVLAGVRAAGWPAPGVATYARAAAASALAVAVAVWPLPGAWWLVQLAVAVAVVAGVAWTAELSVAERARFRSEARRVWSRHAGESR